MAFPNVRLGPATRGPLASHLLVHVSLMNPNSSEVRVSCNMHKLTKRIPNGVCAHVPVTRHPNATRKAMPLRLSVDRVPRDSLQTCQLGRASDIPFLCLILPWYLSDRVDGNLCGAIPWLASKHGVPPLQSHAAKIRVAVRHALHGLAMPCISPSQSRSYLLKAGRIARPPPPSWHEGGTPWRHTCHWTQALCESGGALRLCGQPFAESGPNAARVGRNRANLAEFVCGNPSPP